MLASTLYQLKRPWHLVKTGLLRGLVGQLKYRFPEKKLKIIAITGTDGKTSSSTLLYHVLKQASVKVGLISTVACYIGDDKIDTGLHVTSPDPKQLYELLQKMVEAGVEYVVLEVTSHGAYQYRTWGLKPSIAAVTNITHEHLDYHLSMDEYIKAKAIILNKAQRVVLNLDDPNYGKLRRNLNKVGSQILTYGLTERVAPQVAGAIKQRFKEQFNWLNGRLVYAVAREVGLVPAEIAEGVISFPGIPGRMEQVPTTKKFQVIVDFAHTPNGLKSALTALKKQVPKGGRLIAVYGSAGLRDHQKRPLMGKIGAELADLVVFTAEDPRTEDVWSIIRQMKQELSTNLDKVASVADRGEAIQFALKKLAAPNDLVVILGKGHEQSLCYGKTEYQWSDVEIAKQVLAGKDLRELTPVQ